MGSDNMDEYYDVIDGNKGINVCNMCFNDIYIKEFYIHNDDTDTFICNNCIDKILSVVENVGYKPRHKSVWSAVNVKERS